MQNQILEPCQRLPRPCRLSLAASRKISPCCRKSSYNKGWCEHRDRHKPCVLVLWQLLLHIPKHPIRSALAPPDLCNRAGNADAWAASCFAATGSRLASGYGWSGHLTGPLGGGRRGRGHSGSRCSLCGVALLTGRILRALKQTAVASVTSF